ncbi:MAG: serine--tRNA ligase [Patescibacteria group bacterium]
MLDSKYVREHVEEVKKNCALRHANVDVDAFVKVDAERLSLMQEVESLRAERNVIANEMASVKEKGDREPLIAKGKRLKEDISEKEANLAELEGEWNSLLVRMPNLSHPSVPEGESDKDNVEVRKVGKVRKVESSLNHLQLAEKHDLIDFERGAKVSGAKFYFLKGKLAILEQALIRYGIDFAVREGFEMLTTPDLAKEEVLVAKGFLPRGPEKQIYYVEGEDLALVGTSEITVLGYHMNETLAAEELPKKYVAFSHCFRTEAGAYGRESFGLYRVHQFSKVEMFAFSKPEQSEAIHFEFLRLEEEFWKSLEIPYRVVDCASGDLSGSDYRRFDIEAWMFGKGESGEYGEVTSTSDCWDYQSRGLSIKYASKDGEKGFVHTLNGTVVATPRAMIAILENHQQEDGSIKIPAVLVPYCGFDKIG